MNARRPRIRPRRSFVPTATMPVPMSRNAPNRRRAGAGAEGLGRRRQRRELVGGERDVGRGGVALHLSDARRARDRHDVRLVHEPGQRGLRGGDAVPLADLALAPVTPSATPDQAGTDMFVATLWFVR